MVGMLYIIVGIFLGFMGSIPVAGPISVLVLTLGIRERNRTAFGIAAGGAVAEAVYAFLAFWGFGTYLARYPVVLEVSRGTTFLILLIIGMMLVRRGRRKRPRAANEPKVRTGSAFLIGFMVAILNPTLILTWVAASSAVLALQILPLSPHWAPPFATGVCLGIIGWFALLLRIVTRYRGSFSQASLAKVEFFMGWALICAACVFFVLFLHGVIR